MVGNCPPPPVNIHLSKLIDPPGISTADKDMGEDGFILNYFGRRVLLLRGVGKGRGVWRRAEGGHAVCPC